MAKPASVLSTDTFLTWRTRYNTLLGQVPEVVVSATAPTVNDDITNYENGTLWIHTGATPNDGYLLVDNTDGAAVWALVGVADGSVSTNSIVNNAVTLAKIQDIATDSFLGRNTAGTGDPEVLNNATAKAMLDLSGTNSGDQTSIVGISGTMAQFNTAVTDGNPAWSGTSEFFASLELGAGTSSITGAPQLLVSESAIGALSVAAGTVAVFERNANTSISILSSSGTGIGRVYFGDGANETQGSIAYDHSDDSMDIVVNGSRIISTYNSDGTVLFNPNASGAVNVELNIQANTGYPGFILRENSTEVGGQYWDAVNNVFEVWAYGNTYLDMFGTSSARPGDIEFYSSSTRCLWHDTSASKWDFIDNAIATTGAITGASLVTTGTIGASNFSGSHSGTSSGTNTGDEVAASTTVSGIIELATQTEVNTGTDTVRAVTPSTLAGRAASTTLAGVIELATQAEVDAGSDTVRAITPATLAGYANFPQGGLAPTYKTANYTAVDGDFVVINSAGVARTITLPATIAAGNRIAIHHLNTSATEVLVTVARNAKNIRYQGTNIGDDITLADGETVELVASGTTNWEIV